MIADPYKELEAVSRYQPPKAVQDFTAYVQRDYQAGYDILTRTWPELNDISVIDDMDRGRKMFNAFVDESIDDPAQAWKWRGTRSKARNKGIAMHANLTAAYLIPSFIAQNEDDDVDRDFSDFMRDIVEWMAENSEYKSNFLSLVFAMETDPVVFLGAEYSEIYQKIKEKQEDGSYTTKEIMDEVLSGFKAPIYTADQVLISNAYERNIQKHRFNIPIRWIEYGEAEAKYGKHENWDFVKPGVSTVLNSEHGVFYDVKDDDHPLLVQEVTYKNRRDDTEVCFLGGIYMGQTDVDMNPFKHRDNFGAPKYNLTRFGFYPIGSHFFYCKSMMSALRWDNSLYDAMSEIAMNRAILEVEMPLAISGSDKIDTEIVFPNSVHTFADKDAKVSPLLPSSNLGAIFTALQSTAESIDEGSVNETQAGQLPQASQKAFNVAQAADAAKKIISGVAKGLAESVSQYGMLMADIAIQHLSVPQVDQIVGESIRLKYRSFLLENKNVGGRRVSKQLMFSEDLIGSEMTEDQKKEANLKLLDKTGYPEHTKHIYMANPELFAKIRYLCKSDYEELFHKNDEYMQAMLTNLYAQLNADPMIEREALLRELLYSYFKGRADKFVAKKPMAGMQGLPAANPADQGKTTQPGQQANNKAISTGLPALGVGA